MNKYTELNKSFLNGQWEEGEENNTFDIENPYNNDVLTTVKLASKNQVEEAFDNAKKAQKEWAKDSQKRRDVMEKAIQYYKDNKDDIIDLLVIESGSSVLKSNIEYNNTVAVMEESLKMVDKLGQVTETPSIIENKVNYSYRLPLGVISSIAPFNFPMYLSMRTIAPALALGNAVVHKADLQVGLCSGSLIAKAFEAAGMPAGVFQSILTKSSTIGDTMIENKNVALISFTGSTEVGKRIGSIAGGLLKGVALELGGNGPFVVLKDADIDQAVKAAAFGKFLHSGQICMITNRIIVHKDLYDEFVEKFVERVKNIPYGDPRDPKTIIGPLINEGQVKKGVDNIQKAIDAGTEVLLKGERIGNVLTPTIFGHVKNDSELAQTELFAPIAPIIKADSDEEAIEMANDTRYGLSSSIFSGNIEKATDYALYLEFGMTHVNDQPVNDEPTVPFGGMRDSGVGRFGNPSVVEEFTYQKWISVQTKPREYPF
ncbi:aldehyde dehydrogenase family protein [Rummeliibacillus stabekisii]|uniref:aldehyde dehydrogenase family protein n=1 Tax=Rummeliibacillus stabekisii TaxID=241244 RepID=UPI00116CAE05|nr:aldehyde dehydrogenase family protein [Rummeliibacillus stabekisii]MBB5169414.1 aldehyde dehydrogenase (NAD+) [Rummeliibacillus stabekisii]GEL03673.1 putative aldehyde dehydrogenase AldY [Rummeliibacillus stabekisii]